MGVRGPVKSPGLVGWVMMPAAMLTPPPLGWQVAQDWPALDRVVDSKSRLPSSTSTAWEVAADAVCTALRSWDILAVERPGSPWGSDRPDVPLWLAEAQAATVAARINRPKGQYLLTAPPSAGTGPVSHTPPSPRQCPTSPAPFVPSVLKIPERARLSGSDR